MRTDSLNQFLKLHRQLTNERSQLESRLRAINEALGAMNVPSSASSRPEGPAGIQRGSGRGKRGGGGTSLREHVIAVLQQGAKTKEEVLNAVMARGYKFATNNPLNSLGVILYGKNSPFARKDGKFSVRNDTSKDSSGSPTAKRERKKRQMSAAARARIAAAQRTRWAKQKADK